MLTSTLFFSVEVLGGQIFLPWVYFQKEGGGEEKDNKKENWEDTFQKGVFVVVGFFLKTINP